MTPVRPWHAKKIRRTAQPAGRLGSRIGGSSRFENRWGYKPTRWSRASVAADLLAVVTGLVASFTVRIVGQLAASEILTLGLLPVLLVLEPKRVAGAKLKLIYILMGLWLANQALTDIYRETAADDWMRGNAAIIFFAIDLTFLVILLGKNQQRKIFFITSYAVGTLFAARLQPVDLMESDPWKFGYATGCNLLFLIIASYFYYRGKYVFTGISLAAITAINLLENYRSPVLTILVAVSLTMPIIPEMVGKLRLTPRKGTTGRIVFLVVIAVLAGVTAHSLVHFVTSGGFISEEAQAKNKLQSESGGGILLAGRPELLVSSRAILEHPIVGFGSWARDFKYAEMLNDVQARFGIETDLEALEQSSQGLIPAHSHLMGAWIWAGIFGGVFWAYLFWLSSKGLIAVSNLQPPFALLYATMLFSFLFDILFSPFNTGRRLVDAFVVVIIVDLLEVESVARVSKQLLQRRFRRQPQIGRFISN